MNTHLLAETAQSWVGTPWHWCAAEKGKGCDCAGLVLGAAREAGLTDWRPRPYSEDFDLRDLLLPLNRFCLCVWDSPLLRHNGDVPAPEAGDVLLFAIPHGRHVRPQHLGIATGQRSFIHAYKQVGKVVESAWDRTWQRRLMSVYRWRQPDLRSD